ncbi:MAG: hypothetical protein JXA82_18880 [Sedimentisphaerales bacterium]|nr:hypothetical protein [Sedimentisphaerales bacterium]
MTNGAMAGGAAAAAAASISSAIKASGAIVRIEPHEFVDLVCRINDPIVVWSPPGFLTPYKYITCYKGLYFFAKSKTQLTIPASAEIICARKIWIPE